MRHSCKVLGVILLTMFGIWGCSRTDLPGTAGGDKIKTLETKTAKLEQDLKAVRTANDQLRRQLGDAEEAQTQMRGEIEKLRLVVKERDELVVQLKARTSERDQLQTQYDGFRRNIKDLLGQAEAALPNSSKTVNAGLASRTSSRQPNPGGGGD